VSLVYVNGDIYSQIGLRVKAESPAAKTMVVSVANTTGPQNTLYMPSNEAYTHLTFQMLGNRFKPGCVEDTIAGSAGKLAHQGQ
jgi:neutral ceramidase